MLSAKRTGQAAPSAPAHLQEGWVIANHILVSFHVAFISSILGLPAASLFKSEVLRFIFWSPETILSAVFLYISFHTGIAVHEMGHFLTAARLNALSESLAARVQCQLERPLLPRLLYYARVFLLAPFGRAEGIRREALNYYPDAPYNLAVAAAGPRASRNLAWAALPPAGALIMLGLLTGTAPAIYLGRLFLGIGIVGLLDFRLADRGKYREFKEREARARMSAAQVAAKTDKAKWHELARRMKRRMLDERLQQAVHPRLGMVTAPWQFRNCGMGGRHTEKEYPESNISMQEAMFLILGASDYQEAQEMTVRLQNRLKEVIEKEEGCRVMGIGLEGGLAPYIDRSDYPLPEVRLWALMRRTIEECGLRPGRDVAIALDPAMSELEIAYREENNIPDAIGQYLFWRDKAKIVLDRDGVLAIYEQAIRQYEIPILAIEDGFSENDHEGWKKLLEKFGDQLFIIGDDLVTTNDRTIEMAAGQGLINTALIKPNQIGSLYETLIAMLVALGKGLDLVVSHRSKSPNDDMEAHIALAANALGLKCGGGANTERLVKYQAVAALMRRAPDASNVPALIEGQRALVRKVWGYEEPTNAGIPTVGVEVELALPEAGVALQFRGATPLGTSAGAGEAIHLVDAVIERAEHVELIDAHRALFDEIEPKVFAFKKSVDLGRVVAAGDEALRDLFERARRYQGKGCLNAVDNIRQMIAPFFEGRNLATRTLCDIDRDLLALELRMAQRRGKLPEEWTPDRAVAVMQRKQNLGMNAILSASLALGRAIAHIQGKQLYEILREEMIGLIGRLAAECRVPIDGSQWSDYVRALRAASRVLEDAGRPLHIEIRRLAGIYAGDAAALEVPSGETPEALAILPSEDDRAERPMAASAPMLAQPIDPGARLAELLTKAEQAEIATVTVALAHALQHPDETQRAAALCSFLISIETFCAGGRRLEIANNRVLRAGERILIPYVIENNLVTYVVSNHKALPLAPRKLSPGTILTDTLIARFAGLDAGTALIQPVDLEDELYEFEDEGIDEIAVTRIRDIAALLAQINLCANIDKANYLLHFMVANLGGMVSRAFIGAKNLQPEIRNLMDELARLLNGPYGRRLRFITRVLVRNLSALVLRPNLIDEVWNITIQLAEVQVRGSAIINEIRRSSHHALGQRTLCLARAYLSYLETSDPQPLAELGFCELSPSDLEAPHRDALAGIFHRLVANLEKLLGASETLSRIEEWREFYAESLLQCEFGNSLDQELETLISEGIRAQNSWIYRHHLRVIKRKIDSFTLPPEIETPLRRELAELERLEFHGGNFDPELWALRASQCIEGLIRSLKELYQDELFRELQAVIDSCRQQVSTATFAQICTFRQMVHRRIELGGFGESRCHLYQLDCLLEEMGYLVLRRTAAEFEKHGVDLGRCFDIIRRLIVNLGYDGFSSRELDDLGAMLVDAAGSREEITNVLDHIQHLYHKILRQTTAPCDAMAERLRLSDQDLMALLGNLKRYLHDLEAIAQFCDIARAHVRSQAEEESLRSGATPLPPAGRTPPILHISRREEILAQLGDNVNLREAYGSKGSGLLYISLLNIPTRDGFILPATLARTTPDPPEPGPLNEKILHHLEILERDLAQAGGRRKRFGDANTPLLLAVRGGSIFSMPGMLSTVVFVGMNDRIAGKLAEHDPWQAYDAYRRFLASMGKAIWEVDMETFGLVEEAKERHKVRFKHELPWETMREIAEASKEILRHKGFGEELDALLSDPQQQLFAAVRAVLASWHLERAQRYRELKGLCHSWHTAVIVQEMASGNRRNDYVGEGMDETQASLTGVIPRTTMTRSGTPALAGEIKFSAAGDDLVGGVTGINSLQPISELPRIMPMLHRRIKHIAVTLHSFMGTDQEIEFTVERGELSILQTRMAETAEGKKVCNFAGRREALTRGNGVCGGGFRGLVAFDEPGRLQMTAIIESGRDDVDGVLLVLENPTPDDIPLILSADGVLTAKGGSTSHAAVAVNGIEHKRFSAVLGAAGLKVNPRKNEAVFVDARREVRHRVQTGDVLSIHGTTGEVYIGSLPLVETAD